MKLSEILEVTFLAILTKHNKRKQKTIPTLPNLPPQQLNQGTQLHHHLTFNDKPRQPRRNQIKTKMINNRILKRNLKIINQEKVLKRKMEKLKVKEMKEKIISNNLRTTIVLILRIILILLVRPTSIQQVRPPRPSDLATTPLVLRAVVKRIRLLNSTLITFHRSLCRHNTRIFLSNCPLTCNNV